MSITAVGASSLLSLGATDDPIAASNAKRDAKFAQMLAETEDAKKALAEVTKGGMQGYWEWKIKQLREQITKDVMNQMNLTPEKLAAMPAKERLETLKKIEDMVAEQLKLQIAEEMKKKQNTIISFNNSAQAILSAQGLDLTGFTS